MPHAGNVQAYWGECPSMVKLHRNSASEWGGEASMVVRQQSLDCSLLLLSDLG